VVFAAGFLLGALRVLILAPIMGGTSVVVLELPVILALSWTACRWLTVRIDVAALLGPRLVMGGVALAMLMLAELSVSTLVFGRPLSAHLGQYRELSTMLGLAGQIVFAAFPAIQLSSTRRAGGGCA
jgi:hypothetical protein